MIVLKKISEFVKIRNQLFVIVINYYGFVDIVIVINYYGYVEIA